MCYKCRPSPLPCRRLIVQPAEKFLRRANAIKARFKNLKIACVRQKQAAFLFCRMRAAQHPLSLSFSHFVASAMNTNDQIYKKDGPACLPANFQRQTPPSHPTALLAAAHVHGSEIEMSLIQGSAAVSVLTPRINYPSTFYTSCVYARTRLPFRGERRS
jgi:hypothetical protein